MPDDPGMPGAGYSNPEEIPSGVAPLGGGRYDPTLLQKLREFTSNPVFRATVTGRPDAGGGPSTGSSEQMSTIPNLASGPPETSAITDMTPNVGPMGGGAVGINARGFSQNPSVPIPLPQSSGFSFPDAKTAHAATAHDALSNITAVANAIKQQREQKIERRATIVFNSLHDAISRGDNETVGRMLDPETPEGKANLKLLEKSGIGVPPEIKIEKQKPLSPEEKGLSKFVATIAAKPNPADVEAQKQKGQMASATIAETLARANELQSQARDKESISASQKRLIELERQDPSTLSEADKREMEIRKQFHNVLQTAKTPSAASQEIEAFTTRQAGPNAVIDPKTGKPFAADATGHAEWKSMLQARAKAPNANTAYLNAELRKITGDPNATIETADVDKLDQAMQHRDRMKLDTAQPYKIAYANALSGIQTGAFTKREQILEGKKYDAQIVQLRQAQAAINNYVKQIDAGQNPDASTLAIRLGPVGEAFKTNTGIMGSISSLLGGNKITKDQAVGAAAALDDAIDVINQAKSTINSVDAPSPSKAAGPQEFDFDPKTGTLVPRKK